MERINPKYRMETKPVANSQAVVSGEHYRFTILTSALIRAEYSAEGCFEDRATQVVICREFPVPQFKTVYKDGVLTITTQMLELVYHGGPFTRNSLLIRIQSYREDWHWGDRGHILPGTTRTLDEVNGACKLQDSILAGTGVAVMDDSQSLILCQDGWVQPRSSTGTDAYIFCHHHDYIGALKDYCTLTGKIPLLPRYAFGNWWSRYHRYTQEEYSKLMSHFRKEEIPFSVAVIDMDWHKVKIDPKYGTGWTGFSWDTKLFPDHHALLKELHENDMQVTLNLHPAQGIAAHEDCYPAMAKAMGVDSSTEEKIPFDVTDPKLIEHYFDTALRPLEKEGVTFWWVDWQQGNTTAIPGLDPLWMLNHFHFLDMRSQNKRPMVFSRYAGHGSQRYPVGFSGDTWVTWESLRFQPYFTNMASNVDYCWWSHDIGGHMLGSSDPELTARWVQYGAFSPINRLHSTQNPFMSKEPWLYGRDACASMTRFLQLRHRMIPYLYTMNERTAEECIPLVCPLYFKEPENIQAYFQKNEYYFGSELLVSPITDPADEVTAMGCVKTWLPEGRWFDVFSGMANDGGRMVTNYRTMDEMPVFAKAGAIVPLAIPEENRINSTDNPARLELQVFPEADGSFVLYEDDGLTEAYLQGDCVRTAINWHWNCEEATLTIKRPEGDTALIPEGRKYTVVFRQTDASDVSANADCSWSKTDKGTEVKLDAAERNIVIKLNKPAVRPNPVHDKLFEILLRARYDHMSKARLLEAYDNRKSLLSVISTIESTEMSEHLRHALLEVLTASEA